MIDLDAIEDRHIQATHPMATGEELLNSMADMGDLIAEVRRLQPIARKYERLMETHAVVQGVSLG